MSIESKVEALERASERASEEINHLHSALEKRGVNSRGTKDLNGKEFTVPVDEEHKATALVLFNFSLPHNRAFHTSWFGFFSSFFSMFAAAPLMAYMKKPTSLNLSAPQIGTGNILALSSNIVMRVFIGYISDKIGPRKGMATLLFVSAPAIFGMMFVQDAAAWTACRMVIGVGLATFVTCQVWNSQMYAKKVVGFANATAAGWGNLGGGVTNLTMPFIFLGFFYSVKGSPAEREDAAWRLCYIVPLLMHVLGGIAVLTGVDLPDGNFKDLETSGAKQKANTGIIVKTGFSNVNAWILTATYGMCFGVELTMNSILAPYFYNYHGMSPQASGTLASFYGLMNLFARSLGGLLSDWANTHYGMRGRIWACWIVQTIEGFFCIMMGVTTIGYGAPPVAGDDFTPVQGHTLIGKNWLPVDDIMIKPCGSVQMVMPESFQTKYGVDDSLRMVLQLPEGDGAQCISHQNMVGSCLFVMILFSLCVQAAEGLHYGIVPYVSRPALGIVSGMAGAGGNLGAVISIRAFFFGGVIRTDQGFIYLGIMVMAVTATLLGIYFPDKGGMLFPAGALGSYDPQLIKPPAEYRGADSIDLSAAAGKTSETSKA